MCRGHLTEGRSWLDRTLASADGPPSARLKALHGAGRLAHFQRDAPAARRHLDAALTLARELGDTWALAWILHVQGRVAYFDGDADTARQLGEESLARARTLGDAWLAGWALHLLALAAHIARDYPRARALYEQSIAVRRPIGDLEGIGICLDLLGIVAYSEADYLTARELTCEGLRMLREVAYYPIPTLLATAAGVAARLGQPRRAARLAGAVVAFSEAVDMIPIPLVEEILAQALDLAKQALGDAEFATAWAEGRMLSLHEAIDEGIAWDTPTGDAMPAGGAAVDRSAVAAPGSTSSGTGPVALPPADLTPRETAVLRLIAAGRTTREIAAELFVSVPTVERHITHLYGKIGARGRAAATTYALKHGLPE